jgi:hypothetical protein
MNGDNTNAQDTSSIDARIDAWHSSNSELPLYQYLGMTEKEYVLWVERNILNTASSDIDAILATDDTPELHESAVKARDFLIQNHELLNILRRPLRIWAFERPDAPIIGIAVDFRNNQLKFYFYSDVVKCYSESDGVFNVSNYTDCTLR